MLYATETLIPSKNGDSNDKLPQIRKNKIQFTENKENNDLRGPTLLTYIHGERESSVFHIQLIEITT